MTDIVDIVRPQSTGEAVVMISADKLHRICDEVEQLRKASAMISHELRTPLNAIIGFSQVINQQMLGEVGTEQYVSMAKDIEDSAMHLLSLVNAILEVQRALLSDCRTDEQSRISEVTARLARGEHLDKFRAPDIRTCETCRHESGSRRTCDDCVVVGYDDNLDSAPSKWEAQND